ncbi:NADPH-dependent oxidoreductase [Devosia sp. MC521]|uniref:NADPH-dependent oxidoreductase n=1 Tax=Devosia sp. MC521 TaxID=2759954 RepID=UPI0015FBB2A1|nr:NADPH-dependent oxidoreductase [Devosia sp. MC521]MBJ6987395.1 NADPH-dependent oxidoreductase [Devosia sp. MC521]QMW63564.1 NADPH-dependent oxidoreductase [Devosia sp. MC521]
MSPAQVNTDAKSQNTTAATRLARRYGVDAPQTGAVWSDTIGLMLDHRSARAYLPKPVEHGVIEALVAAAQSAPTSSNVQAWSVVVVRDAARKARLAELSGGNPHIVAAPVFLVWIADLARLRTLAQREELPGDGLDYMESFLIGVIDSTLAAQNTVVAASSLGLGSCYIGGMRNKPAEVAAELGLPKECVAVFGLTLGYPDEERASEVKPRLPQSIVLHEETYGDAADAETLARYDQTMRGFQEKQGMTVIDWTKMIAKRVGTVKALRGREALSGLLKGLGFGLK